MRWKKLQKISSQDGNNAKCYAILRDVFDFPFLSSHVKWGQVLTKGEKKMGNENSQTIFLCNQDEFIDMSIEIFGLANLDRRSAKKVVGEVVKNLIRNKIKRDNKK